jgi:hypothetical protein
MVTVTLGRSAMRKVPLRLMAVGLAWGFVTPASVRASTCADRHYVTLSTSEHDDSASLDALSRVGSLASRRSEVPHNPAPTPCTGWRCQNAPVSSGTAAPPVPLRSEQGFSLLLADSTVGAPVSRWVALEPAVRPSHRGPYVFHPPR